jgi:hypothetical protein
MCVACIQVHRFEWVLMLDNSGSMRSKRREVLQAVTLIMEVLRRLECPFAVVRFGMKGKQRTLKRMQDHFSSKRGQAIFDGYTCDEGTYPASACAYVAKAVWPSPLAPEEQVTTPCDTASLS